MSASDDLNSSGNGGSVELPPLYYLHNFDQMLAHVLSQYDDLLHHDERQTAAAITQLDTTARALLVRFFTRKGWIFRPDKLVYSELANIAGGLQALMAKGLIHSGQPEDNAALGYFTKAELLATVKSLNSQNVSDWKRLKRPELEQRLIEWELASELNQRLAEQTVWVSERVQTFLIRMQLLYFGNLHQSLTEFVLRDLGLYRYHDYALDKRTRGFDSRAMLDRHLHYYQLLEKLDTLNSDDTAAWCDLDKQLAELQQQDDADHRLQRRIQRQRLHIARHLERQQQPELALQGYQQLQLHPARERRIRILAKTSPQEAWEICRQAWQAPVNDQEHAFLAAFIPRLQRRLKQPDTNWFQPLSDLDEHYWTLSEADTELLGQRGAIERLALDGLQQRQAGKGFHVENALFTAVFGLLFWPVVFAPVSGAFFHPFQSKPDDYGEPGFWERRQEAADRIWQQLEYPQWHCVLEERIRRYQDTLNPLVNWRFVGHAQASGFWQQALERIPAVHWKAVFRYMAADLNSRTSGLPDLIWFPDAGGVQLYEVKGPGDTVKGHQAGWLRHLKAVGMDASVLYLTRM